MGGVWETPRSRLVTAQVLSKRIGHKLNERVGTDVDSQRCRRLRVYLWPPRCMNLCAAHAASPYERRGCGRHRSAHGGGDSGDALAVHGCVSISTTPR